MQGQDATNSIRAIASLLCSGFGPCWSFPDYPHTSRQRHSSSTSSHKDFGPTSSTFNSDPNVPTPERIWINGFPFEVQPSIQQKHWDNIKGFLPEAVQQQAKFEGKGLSTTYSVRSRQLPQLLTLLRPFARRS